jgi:glycosyltransferase involved in cell wall biosynthesis
MPSASPAPTDRIAIVTPVYNDWESFRELIRRIDAMAGAQRAVAFDVIAVDDGSTAPTSADLLAGTTLAHVGRIDVLHLACNLGHQRAIAIGLVEMVERARYSAAIVMDSDGEDRPEDIPGLLAALREHPGHVVVARRARRTEGAMFRISYALYKLLFRLLTGKPIAFGNFCVLPEAQANRLVAMPEIWNNLAAAVSRSRIPIHPCPTDRGTRYAGQSKMNMVSLVIHGLSAVSVYSDIAFTRILVLSVGLAAAVLCGIVAVAGIRLLTDLAIPGWASYMVGSLAVILMQTLVLSAGTVFLLLNYRSMPSIVPRRMSREFVTSTTNLSP